MKKRIFAVFMALCLLISSASALTVEQTGELLKEYFIGEVPQQVLEQPTIDAMLEALGDPYTEYYTAEEYAEFLAAVEDVQLVGLGIRGYYLDEGVLLTQVVPNGPADNGGLMPGDYIIAINGNNTCGAPAEKIDGWIRGDEGSFVMLLVRRGEDTFHVQLQRRRVVFPTAALEKIENRIGWITCESFGSKTFQQFYDIVSAHDDEVDEWVIDLRSNSGGDVFSALFSAGCFAGAKQGTYARGGNGSYYGYLFDPELIWELGYSSGVLSAFDENGFVTMDPAHVLVSENTASAAELFCAVIRDSGAGLIIGERTYGKGVAQILLNRDTEGLQSYFEQGDALKITVERMYSTKGGTYDKVGIIPHFMVEADLADEVASLLFAPVTEGEEVLHLCNLTSTSRIADNVMIPLRLLRAKENASAVRQLMESLPATAYYMISEAEGQRVLRAEEAEELVGVSVRERTFTDLRNLPSADAIRTLCSYGIVSGFGDGTFRPEDTLDRAFLCALLVKALRCPLPEEGSVVFSDVPADAWFAPYVNALAGMGLVQGCGDGTFRPYDCVSHEELLTVLGRAAQWLNMNYYELARRDGVFGERMPDEEKLGQLYPDYAQWAREMVWLCDGELTWTGVGSIEAKAAATREEAALSVYKLFRVSGVIPS